MKDADLRTRLDNLEAQQGIARAADEALELAQRDHLPLEHALGLLLPIVVSRTGAAGVWLQTLSEDLRVHDYGYPDGSVLDGERGSIVARSAAGERYARTRGEGHVIAQPLDVAGEHFGTVALLFDERQSPARADAVAGLLDAWCEVLDNYLASIARSRRKHAVTMALSDALKSPVLDKGLDDALALLQEAIPFDQLVLVYQHEQQMHQGAVSYRLRGCSEPEHFAEVLSQDGGEFISGGGEALRQCLGVVGGCEEVLIHSLQNSAPLGRLIVTSRFGDFNTYDRDLLERFADYLRQRIVDFNREWKRFNSVFSRPTVRKLLRSENYLDAHLKPRVEDVAMLFCDISGFTRISESVLKDPTKIGALIDGWGEAVVDLIWSHGGTFDKMVGDCVIALWGPPFFDANPAESCKAALATARAIRDFTQTLNDGRLFPELAAMGEPIGVATGLHFGSACVGLFGPNEDYTAFSSVMNNCARLQGVAARDEILCMEEFVALTGEEGFGEVQEASVKNVAVPLRFRSWQG